jgi:XTP/dITP diphosphohydrolase
VTAIVWKGGTVSMRGEISGRIVARERGAHGFGYDPLFFSDELSKTLGEATREEKSRVSHRARAVRAVLDAFAECACRERNAGVDRTRDGR